MALGQEESESGGALTLFNGVDLTHWLADPMTLAHWRVEEGVLVTDGKGGNLVSEENFRDGKLTVEWRAQAGSSGGIYLRSRPRVEIADPAKNESGSGGLALNKKGPNKPTAKADKPAGEWNTFVIDIVGDKVTVTLNDQVVVENVVMENAFDSSRRIPVNGKIELEAKGPMAFRGITFTPTSSEDAP